MRIVKLVLISTLIFLLLSVIYLKTPSHYRYEITDWFGRLFAPSFDTALDDLAVREQLVVISEYKKLGYKLKCYGNLRPNEKIGESDDYLCWGLISSAFEGVPARLVTFFFTKNELHHVRLEFPESSLSRVQDYLSQIPLSLDNLPIFDFGVDDKGVPLKVWKVKKGLVTTSNSTSFKGHSIVLWSSTRSIVERASKRQK